MWVLLKVQAVVPSVQLREERLHRRGVGGGVPLGRPTPLADTPVLVDRKRRKRD